MKSGDNVFSKIATAFSVAAGIAMILFYAHFYFAETVSVTDNRKIEEYSLFVATEKTTVEDPSAPVGTYSKYRFEISENGGNDFSLAFYLVHQYVEVFIDGKEVYSVKPAENSVTKTVGSYWVVIPLFAEDAGKEITVNVIPAYEEFAESSTEFYVGSAFGIFMSEATSDFGVAVLCILVIFVGLVYILAGAFLRFKKIGGKTITLLGVLSILLGAARITDTKTLQFFVPNKPVLLFFMSIIPMLIGTLPLLMFLRRKLNTAGRTICNVAGIIISMTGIAMILLQLLGIAEIRENLRTVHMVLVFGAVCVASTIPLFEGKRKIYRLAPLVIVATGVFTDIALFYKTGTSAGLIASLAAVLVYDIFMGTRIITDFVENENKIKRQAEELQENRISIMLSQIQQHFLYNSISAIRELCRQDPEEARNALGDFAGYLRGNMDSLRERRPVPFSKELDHIETYLRLEKMRFGDELNVVLNIAESDFLIPFLTVQPLVENAVKHGVCIGEGGGTVTLSTEKANGKIIIKVTDDGAGFDPSAPINDTKGRSHVGIENVRNRLEIMVGGVLEIESRPGKGTVATIFLDEERKV